MHFNCPYKHDQIGLLMFLLVYELSPALPKVIPNIFLK